MRQIALAISHKSLRELRQKLILFINRNPLHK